MTARNRIGIDPIAHCHLIENHDEACYLWKEAGVRHRTLVHIDAHHDMYGGWDEGKSNVTIANYVLPAVLEGIVDEVVWVVADRMFESRAGRSFLMRQVTRLPSRPATAAVVPRFEHNRIESCVFDSPLIVCGLSQLPCRQDVLLDIDVDFLIQERLHRNPANFGEIPWLWPDQLVDRLKRQRVSSHLVTIAYSVEGGYTPLQWRHLGEQLALHLRSPQTDAGLEAAYRLLNEAVRRYPNEKCLDTAIATTNKALRLAPSLAGGWFQLSHLYAARGTVAEARDAYRRAVELDPGYRDRLRNSWIGAIRKRRWEEARGALARYHLFDPEHPQTRLGLGMLAIHDKDWGGACTHLEKVVETTPGDFDAQRLLGSAYRRTRQTDRAIAALQRSIKLSVNGATSCLDQRIMTHRPSGYMGDRRHKDTYFIIADLYRSQGARDKAIQFYRLGLAFCRTPALAARLRLLSLLLKNRNYPLLRKETNSALRHLLSAFSLPAIKRGWGTLLNARTLIRKAYPQPRQTLPSLWRQSYQRHR